MKNLWLVVLAVLLGLGLTAGGDDGRVADNATPVWLLTREVKCAADGTVESSKVISYHSDGLPAEISWQNENGEITRSLQYEYNADGMLKSTYDIYSDGYRTDIEYEYDEDGRNVGTRHWEGVGDERHLVGETTTTYEGAKYQYSVWYDDDGAVSYMAHIVYNEQDNLLNAVNTNADGALQSSTEWIYDEAGRQVAYRQYDGDGMLTYSYDNTYDECGNKVSVSGGWIGENDTRTTEYEYDEQGNLVRQIVKIMPSGEVTDYTEYTYDEDGRKTAQIYYIGSLEDGDWADEYRYVYDGEGNLVKQESVDEDGRVYAWRKYEYMQVMVPAVQAEWWTGV